MGEIAGYAFKLQIGMGCRVSLGAGVVEVILPGEQVVLVLGDLA